MLKFNNYSSLSIDLNITDFAASNLYKRMAFNVPYLQNEHGDPPQIFGPLARVDLYLLLDKF